MKFVEWNKQVRPTRWFCLDDFLVRQVELVGNAASCQSWRLAGSAQVKLWTFTCMSPGRWTFPVYPAACIKIKVMFWFNFLVEIIFTDSWELLHNLTLLTFRGSCFSQGRRVPIVAEPERGSSAFTAFDEIGAKFTAETLKIERKKRKPEVIGACRMEGHKAPQSHGTTNAWVGAI